MLPIVVSSLVVTKMRSMRQIVPQKWREHWEEYLELRILVMMSLTFQITLIAVGGRRKKIQDYWIRILVWCAYLSADAVAIYAVGVIRIEPSLNSSSLLRVFWAPFLLMHLGGPDTITAYALEDNELWLRHCLILVSQAVVTLYLLFQTWNGSYISWFYVVILICGLIKYSERVWALRAASTETFQDSTPQRQHRIPKILERLKRKENEGHVVVAHQVIDLDQGLDVDIDMNCYDEESSREYKHSPVGEILVARSLIDIFQPAFTDQQLSFDDAHSVRLTFKDMPYQSVFNIIAIELGFIYDLLFTKAMLFQLPWGVASRVVTLSLTTITLVVFTFTSLREKNASKYNKTDLGITLVLVVAAVFLELYGSLFQHLSSDKFICWLIKHKHSSILSIINLLRPLSKRQRWSGKIGQFSLLSYSLKEKHYLCRHEIRGIQRHFYLTHRNVRDVLKDRLYNHVKIMPTPMYTDLQSLWELRWKDHPQLKKHLSSLQWSINLKELEFDMCILIWHVATDICCHTSHCMPEDVNVEHGYDGMLKDAVISLDLSRYMLHLLVMYPALLPAVIGRIKFKDMHSTMTTFFKPSSEPQTQEARNEEPNIFYWYHKKCSSEAEDIIESDSTEKLTDACNKLLMDQRNLTVSSTEKSKIVKLYSCRLAWQLIEEIKDPRLRFWLLRETWIGLLVLAAVQSKASHHLQHLRRGGELLTHVWLLLVHFGLTDHFRIPHNLEIVELIIK